MENGGCYTYWDAWTPDFWDCNRYYSHADFEKDEGCYNKEGVKTEDIEW